MKHLLVLFFWIFCASLMAVFSLVSVTGGAIFTARYGSVAWGDYDQDGDLDLVLSGLQSGAYGDPLCRIITNNGNNNFTTALNLPPIFWSSSEWGDYDNDGDLDLLITGHVDATGSLAITLIYQNNNGSFYMVEPNLPHVDSGDATWGDFDLDGDLDILLTGYENNALSRVYRNDGNNIFADINAGIVALYESDAEWADLDNDNYPDIIVSGSSISGPRTLVYRNNQNGSFTYANPGMTHVRGSIATFDLEGDGDLDVLILGDGSTNLYRNDGGMQFTTLDNSGLPGLSAGYISSGDIDNDGDIDLLLSGYGSIPPTSNVYLNNGNGSFAIADPFTGVFNSCSDLGDYDNDGRLDIILAGYVEGYTHSTKLYKNYNPVHNNRPLAPEILWYEIDENYLHLYWSEALDDHTPSFGKTYAIRIGSTPGGCDILSPMSNLETGYRLLPRRGIAPSNCHYRMPLESLPYSSIYWSVQAIDGAYMGSEFSQEELINLGTPNSDATNSPVSRIIQSVYPNPASTNATIDLKLTGSANIRVDIYNLRGEAVNTLFHGTAPAGAHQLEWNLCDRQGLPLSNGVYFVVVRNSTTTETRKLIVVR